MDESRHAKMVRPCHLSNFSFERPLKIFSRPWEHHQENIDSPLELEREKERGGGAKREGRWERK